MALFCASVAMNAQFRNTIATGLAAPPPGAVDENAVKPKEVDVQADSLKGFSFKSMYRGLTGKEDLKMGYALLSSAILPGSMQIYNKDYWKLPIIYGGIGAGIYGGIRMNNLYQQTGDATYRTYSYLSYAGAALVYWGSMVDGVASKTVNKDPDPGKAAVLSALLPGLGQAYNGDWWHIPIWYGGLAVCGYMCHYNDAQYKRFSYLYDVATGKEGYTGQISPDQSKYYRDLYRRYRDYSVIATILVYALNIIDANVFAAMSDFNVNDDLALNVSPTLISPLNPSFTPSRSIISAPNAFGINLSLTLK